MTEEKNVIENEEIIDESNEKTVAEEKKLDPKVDTFIRFRIQEFTGFMKMALLNEGYEAEFKVDVSLDKVAKD